jgi:hypothetical protein
MHRVHAAGPCDDGVAEKRVLPWRDREHDNGRAGFRGRLQAVEVRPCRVGILKNNFLNGVPRAKGFENRCLQVAWAVLAHNLWVVARQPWAKENKDKLPAAA